jgi:hypothetical protein
VEGQREGNTKKTKQMCVRQTSDATEMLDELLSFFHVDSQFPDHTNLQSTHFKKDLAEKKARTELSHTKMGGRLDTPLAEWLSAHARARANSDCA